MFCYLILDFYVKTRIRFSLRDKRLFEITRVDCIYIPGVLTGKPLGKPLERTVVYIQIFTFLVYLLKSPIVNNCTVKNP